MRDEYILTVFGLPIYILFFLNLIMLIVRNKKAGGFIKIIGSLFLYSVLGRYLSYLIMSIFQGTTESRLKADILGYLLILFFALGVVNIGSFILMFVTRRRKYLSAFLSLLGVLSLEIAFFSISFWRAPGGAFPYIIPILLSTAIVIPIICNDRKVRIVMSSTSGAFLAAGIGLLNWGNIDRFRKINSYLQSEYSESIPLITYKPDSFPVKIYRETRELLGRPLEIIQMPNEKSVCYHDKYIEPKKALVLIFNNDEELIKATCTFFDRGITQFPHFRNTIIVPKLSVLLTNLYSTDLKKKKDAVEKLRYYGDKRIIPYLIEVYLEEDKSINNYEGKYEFLHSCMWSLATLTRTYIPLTDWQKWWKENKDKYPKVPLNEFND